MVEGGHVEPVGFVVELVDLWLAAAVAHEEAEFVDDALALGQFPYSDVVDRICGHVVIDFRSDAGGLR